MTETIPYSPPVLLSGYHVCDSFDCGNIVLNDWLRRYVLQNQRANAARTFVVCQGSEVVGYAIDVADQGYETKG